MNRDARIYVAGHRGLVGSAIVRKLQAEGYTNLLLKTSKELDLRDPVATQVFFEAKLSGSTVTLWVSGTPLSDFLHVDDLADASIFFMRNHEGDEPVNLGTRVDVTIRELAEVVGFTGEVVWDAARSDGTPCKQFDVSRLIDLGWKASIPLEQGLKGTYAWFQDHGSDRLLVQGAKP